MKVTPVTYIEQLIGSLSPQDRYYFRRYKGNIIVQRKPTKASIKQIYNRQNFGLRYGSSRKKSPITTPTLQGVGGL